MDQLLVFIPAIVALVAVGWGLKRIGFLSRADVEVINKIIVYVSLPALIFLAVQRAQLSFALAKMPLFAILIMLVCLAAAYGLGRLLKLSPALMGAFLLVAAMGNTGYLGFPLTIGLLGQASLVKSVFYDFGTVTLLFSLGVMAAEHYGDPEHKSNVWREFILFPSVIALIAGLILNPVPLPAFLLKALDYVSAATVPLIMLAVGLTLEAKRIGRYARPLAAVVVIKLLLSPLFAFAAAKTGALPQPDLAVIVLEASMPAVMLSLVVGLKYKLDVEFTSLAIVVTIIVSLITIPAVQAGLRLLGA
jgi:malate permease and related proteins